MYDQPLVSAIGGKEVEYDFIDSFVLHQENGVEANRDWTVRARIWGEQEGIGEISQQVQFRVVP
ncbi:MAG: hypothetical protein HKN87_00065 [Saprospiraceae bacterium]|nr:hypothetical protein [Saprospiraceae bacterium]